ncbi:DUF6134 family protein [Rhodovibrionaceae bacterium A322]
MAPPISFTHASGAMVRSLVLSLALGLTVQTPAWSQSTEPSGLQPSQAGQNTAATTGRLQQFDLKPADPAQPRPSVNRYSVLRDGDLIGSHTVAFTPTESGLQVDVETKMAVKLLFFTAYRYHYKSRETWTDNKLLSVETEVNDNGEVITTSARSNDQGYLSSKGESSRFIQTNLIPTNHWNRMALLQPALFNTITAQLNEVTIEATPDPQHFKVRGELNIDTFYDQSGNWLGMKFKHEDNSDIEFRCLDCTNTPEMQP